MVYMVLWEQVLTPIYAINEWEAFDSLEKHKRKKPFKTQGYKRMCKIKQIEEKGQIVGVNARGSYYLYYLLRFFPNFFSFDTFCILVFLYVFPIMGACCAQIKGFTLGWRELVLVRPNVKPFI